MRNGKIKLMNKEEIVQYVERAGSHDKALLKVIVEKDSTRFPESKVQFTFV